MSKIVYASAKRTGSHRGPVVRLLHAFIMLGVWVLVGLAGLVAWGRLTT